jgi:hypothetical protein
VFDYIHKRGTGAVVPSVLLGCCALTLVGATHRRREKRDAVEFAASHCCWVCAWHGTSTACDDVCAFGSQARAMAGVPAFLSATYFAQRSEESGAAYECECVSVRVSVDTSQNLLLTATMDVKLCDFGLSRVKSMTKTMSRIGTVQVRVFV